VPAADGVEVEVGASASADVAGAVVGDVGDSTDVGLRAEVGVAALVRDVGDSAEVGVAALVRDVGDSADVGVSFDVGVAVLVRVGRVGAVAVTLGDSVTLGAGPVPERSVEGRVADSLPPPAPQPLSQSTRPDTSPAETHALPARRPRMRGITRRSLLGGTTRRDSIQDVRIDDTSGATRAGGGSTPGMRRRPFFDRGSAPGITRSG
jgi:hypothetical protein